MLAWTANILLLFQLILGQGYRSTIFGAFVAAQVPGNFKQCNAIRHRLTIIDYASTKHNLLEHLHLHEQVYDPYACLIDVIQPYCISLRTRRWWLWWVLLSSTDHFTLTSATSISAWSTWSRDRASKR